MFGIQPRLVCDGALASQMGERLVRVPNGVTQRRNLFEQKRSLLLLVCFTKDGVSLVLFRSKIVGTDLRSRNAMAFTYMYLHVLVS